MILIGDLSISVPFKEEHNRYTALYSTTHSFIWWALIYINELLTMHAVRNDQS